MEQGSSSDETRWSPIVQLLFEPLKKWGTAQKKKKMQYQNS